jgi:hypothetical protein
VANAEDLRSLTVASMAFLRFVLSQRHPDSGVEDGVFSVAYELRDSPEVHPDDREQLRNDLAWFEQNLATPDRFNRTTSKGHYRRVTKGIAWFRDTASDCIARMHQLKRVLESNGHHVTMILENRIGYVVYEDDLQVVAEPFSETKTSG